VVSSSSLMGELVGSSWRLCHHQYMQCSNKCLAVAEMGDCLATIDMEGTLGGAGSPYNTMWPGPRPTSVPNGILIYARIWPQYMGREVGAVCALFGGGSLAPPHNVVGPRPTSIQPLGHNAST